MRRKIVFMAVLAFLLSAGSVRSQDESSHVHVLIVVDTLDRLGGWWGQDGVNFRHLLSHAFDKQELKGRYTITTLSGPSAHPAKIRDYYKNLKAKPQDTLVFYYSGHGATHPIKGHFLALRQGGITRAEIIDLIKQHKPRLGVVLTDCCANVTFGFRPTVATAGFRGASFKEPPAEVKAVEVKESKAVVRAKFEEPSKVQIVRREIKFQPSPVLVVGRGKAIPFQQLIAGVDGKGVRHLFFKEAGFVDINGSERGKVSIGGPPRSGGSMFTRAFIVLQHGAQFPKLDADKDGLLEWPEMYAAVRQATAKLTGGRQRPEAWHLNGKQVVLGPAPNIDGKSLVIRGKLNGAPTEYRLQLKQGVTYTIKLESNDFDPVLELRDDQRRRLAFDDDSGGGPKGLNSLIRYTPNRDGAYRVVCRFFGFGGRGNYTLTISPPARQLPMVVGKAAAAVKVGQVFNGVLNNRELRVAVNLKAGQAYVIDMQSRQFDTLVRLIDPTGRQVGEDDDGGEKLNSRLPFIARRTGTYQIVCTSFGGNGRGAFTLRVSRRAAGGAIKPGQVFNGVMKDRELVVTVPLKAGRRYVIDMQSRQFDTVIRVLDPTGKLVGQDDDGGEGRNSRLTLTARQSGTYQIICTSFLGSGRGAFTLSVREK